MISSGPRRRWRQRIAAIVVGLVSLPLAFSTAAQAAPVSVPQTEASPRADGRLIDIRLALQPKARAIEAVVEATRDRPPTSATLSVYSGHRRVHSDVRTLGSLNRSVPVTPVFTLPELPNGDLGVVVTVPDESLGVSSQFLAIRRHHDGLIAADSFAGLADAALAADRSTGAIDETTFQRSWARLHQASGSAGTFRSPAIGPSAKQSLGSTTTVSGSATYRDRGMNLRPVRGAAVDLVDDMNFSFGLRYTDLQGNFTLSMADLPAGTYRVRVSTDGTFGSLLYGQSGQDSHKVVSSPMALSPGGSWTGVRLDLPQESETGRAFALFDALHTVGTFYQSIRKSGWDQTLTVRYPNGEERSKADPLTHVIFIGGGDTWCPDSSDPSGTGVQWCPEDAFDWDVLAHESGHVVSYQAGLHASPGGKHYRCDAMWAGTRSKQDALAFAWSEGWATFYGVAALKLGGVPAGIPNAGDDSYQDLRGLPPHNNGDEVTYGMETRACGSGEDSGEDSEDAVSGALWDMWDNGPFPDESLAWGLPDMLDRLDAANATTFNQALTALSANRAAQDTQALRQILETWWFAPMLTYPGSGVISKDPVRFRWDAHGSTNHPNNQFTLTIRDAATGALLVSYPTTGTEYLPDLTTWRRIGESGTVVVYLAGSETSAPATGAYESQRTLIVSGVPDVPRLMVVGDSISHGGEGDYTWRYRLKQHFDGLGQPVDFVGPHVGTNKIPGELPANYPTVQPPPSFDGAYGPDGSLIFDSAHLAQWGWQAAQAKSAIQAQVSEYHPDYLLVELGFNDLAWSVSDPDGLVGSIQQLVANARAANPTIRVLIGNVVHRTPLSNLLWLNGTIDTYNGKLAAAIPGMNTAASPVRLVDLVGSYDPQLDTYDGLHPNGMGDYKIARAFANVFASQLSLGAPFGSIPSSLPAFRPAAPTSMTVEAVPAGIRIHWAHSFGAGGYWLYSRNVTLNEGFSRSALPIPADTWTVSWVLTGHTYEYYVVPQHGDYLGDPSPTGRATAAPWTAGGPINIVVTPLSGAIDLSWEPPQTQYSDSVYKYVVYYNDDSVAGSIMQTSETAGRSIRLSGLTNGHRYILAISSVNMWGTGWPSGAPAAIPGYGRPGTPTLQRARITSRTDVHLEWGAVPGAAGYYYTSRDWVSGAPFSQSTSMTGGTSQDIGWLFPGSDRKEFCLVAANGSLQSPVSNCLRAQLDPPTLLSVRLIDDWDVELRWLAVPGATKYDIYNRDLVKGTGFYRVATVTGTSHQIGWLFDGADKYEWYVVAATDNIVSAPSNAMVGQY